jgi:hypothetical protein
MRACKDAARARGVSGKGKLQRSRADDTRTRPEPARPAQQLSVPIELVAVLHERRPEDVPRRCPAGTSTTRRYQA